MRRKLILVARSLSTESFSEHGYDTVGLINSMRNTVMNTVDLGRVCKLTRYMVRETALTFRRLHHADLPFFSFPQSQDTYSSQNSSDIKRVPLTSLYGL